MKTNGNPVVAVLTNQMMEIRPSLVAPLVTDILYPRPALPTIVNISIKNNWDKLQSDLVYLQFERITNNNFGSYPTSRTWKDSVFSYP